MSDRQLDESFYRGLRSLAESAFPKRCANCGRVYETAEAFLLETERVHPQRSGLKQALDDEDGVIVEVFRNCICGSTLMDVFDDRRDMSESGNSRRKRFEQLLEYLVGKGLTPEVAREELLKLMRGEKSEVLASYKPRW